jgi:soluble lytic murein transglycosylase-like protein
MRWPMVAAAALLAYAGYEWSKQQEAGAALADTVEQVTEELNNMANTITGYSYAKVPIQYRAAIAGAESTYGLPGEMLARLLWQECRYNPKIIDCRIVSTAGALGIAQFMPATAAEMGINPLDPFAAIDAAGRYLRSLYRQTSDWKKALAAYNWGIGNVKRKGLAAAPRETRNYFTQILADIGLGGLYA